jgi:hypothetical protein
MGFTLASRSIDGAAIRVGGSSAGGRLVGEGEGVGVGVGVSGTGVGIWLVGVGSGSGGVIVHSGRRSGVGPSIAGVLVGVCVAVGVGVAVGVSLVGVVVGSGGAVSAKTTAPASEITGAGGWLTRTHTPQPKPARIRIPPNINITLDRLGNNLFMLLILAQSKYLVKSSCVVV